MKTFDEEFDTFRENFDMSTESIRTIFMTGYVAGVNSKNKELNEKIDRLEDELDGLQDAIRKGCSV